MDNFFNNFLYGVNISTEIQKFVALNVPSAKYKTHLKKHGIVTICLNSTLYWTWNIYMYVSLQIASWYLRGFSADSGWATFKLIRTGKTKSLLLSYALGVFFMSVEKKNVGLKFIISENVTSMRWTVQTIWLLLAHIVVSSTCIHAFIWSCFSLQQWRIWLFRLLIAIKGGGSVVKWFRAPDLQFGGPAFESRSHR